VEYSRHGTVIKGQEKARVKSRYEEDIYPSNHTVCTALIFSQWFMNFVVFSVLDALEEKDNKGL
jgi:hypothetical protein